MLVEVVLSKRASNVTFIDEKMLQQIKLMWSQGFSVPQIAHAISRGNRFVINRLNDIGINRTLQKRQLGIGICIECSQQFRKQNTRSKLCQLCLPHKAAELCYYRYGLTWPQREAMYESQQRKCKLCFKSIKLNWQKNQDGSSVVDHCHLTNQVRGLLCNKCNMMVGYVEQCQDPQTFLKRISCYLVKKSDDILTKL